MKPPRFAKDHPDRLADLEEQLEPFVYASMSAGAQAGYDYREIELAVMHLALNFTKQLGTEAKANAAAMAARRKSAH